MGDEDIRYLNKGETAVSVRIEKLISDAPNGGGLTKDAVSERLVASLEMSADDQSDYERFKKLLDRVGKAIVMSAESETSEIIRRRLFEWDPRAVSGTGRVLLPKAAVETCAGYAAWLQENKHQIPSWFSVDHAKETFESTYPFHPMVLSLLNG